MFRTKEDHEVPAFAFIHGAGIRMWRAVGLELRIPYFLIVQAHKEDEAWFHDSYLLWGDADLLNMFADANSNCNQKIVHLSIVIPDDTTAGWKMEEVSEVWTDSNVKMARPPVLIGKEGQILASQKLVRPFSRKTRHRVYFNEAQSPHRAPVSNTCLAR